LKQATTILFGLWIALLAASEPSLSPTHARAHTAN
jgi:hypothetical protein